MHSLHSFVSIQYLYTYVYFFFLVVSSKKLKLAQQFPLSKENFEHLHIPNLLINIWSYNDEDHHLNVGNCETCRQYEKWCIELASGNLNLNLWFRDCTNPNTK